MVIYFLDHKGSSENHVLGQLKDSVIIKIQFELLLFATLVSGDCLIPVFELF
jgi:hypothetical protein